MDKLRAFLFALGFVASLATAAVISLEVVLAYGLWLSTSTTRIVAVAALGVEAIVLVLLVLKLGYSVASKNHKSKTPYGVLFASDLIASVIATLLSVALLILIAKAADTPKAILAIPSTNALIGSCIALASAFTSQILFFVIHFVLHRLPESEHARSLHANEEGRLPPQFPMRVRSVPYSRTKPALSQATLNERGSSVYSSRLGTSGSRSAVDTIHSLSGSFSSLVRPTASRTRLIPHGSRLGRRPDSLDSDPYHDRSSGTEDGFDSWDTSSVDPHNRQMVLETSSPTRSRFLETIPASPEASRSPSPCCPLDLEPPKRGRTRSYTPQLQTPQERNLTPPPLPPPESELHIHPLFRSDSPGPLPAVTPGTVVVASPNAGQFITGKSVTRMRSGSLLKTPSPLNGQGSHESLQKTPSPNEGLSPEEVAGERKMTPPIPDWVLNAGSEASLAEFPSKR